MRTTNCGRDSVLLGRPECDETAAGGRTSRDGDHVHAPLNPRNYPTGVPRRCARYWDISAPASRWLRGTTASPFGSASPVSHVELHPPYVSFCPASRAVQLAADPWHPQRAINVLADDHREVCAVFRGQRRRQVRRPSVGAMKRRAMARPVLRSARAAIEAASSSSTPQGVTPSSWLTSPACKPTVDASHSCSIGAANGGLA